MKGFSIFLKLLSCFWLREGGCSLKQMRRRLEDGPAARTRGQWVSEPGHRPLTESSASSPGKMPAGNAAAGPSGFLGEHTDVAQSVACLWSLKCSGAGQPSRHFLPQPRFFCLRPSFNRILCYQCFRHKIPLPWNSVTFDHMHKKMNYSKNSHFETSVFFCVGLLFMWINYNFKIVAVLWQRWGLLNFLSSSKHTKEGAVLMDASLL